MTTKNTWFRAGQRPGCFTASSLLICACATQAIAQQAAPAPAVGSSRLTQTYTLSSGNAITTTTPIMTGRFSRAVCAEEPPLENFTGTGPFVSVPGFALGEECAVVLDAPAAHYPIEILRVRIGWSSPSGGAPPSLEDSIRIYSAGLPNPGAFQYSIGGPVLTDGGINEFDLTTAMGGIGSRIINSGPFMVSLRIGVAESPGSPAPIHDANGCQPGKNAIFASPAFAWFDACTLGVSGDWVMSVTYRQVNCAGATDCNNNGVSDALEIAANPALDCDNNGVLDSCQIAANPALDANGNGVLDSCETPPAACPADVTGNGVVNAADLAELIGSWGPCP